MTEPFQPASSADHGAHDPTWMAALASRDHDLSPTEHTRAQAALEACDACANLFAELVAVSAAIPLAATPARPREFTLTPADAARLRTRGFRRWLSAIGSARDGITFPLAMGLTTMGIAGLLLATLPSAFSGTTSMTALSTVGAPVEGAGGASSAPSAAAPAPSAAAAAASGAPAAASVAPVAQSSELYGASGGPGGETTSEGAFTGDDGDGQSQRDAAVLAQEAAIRDDRSGMTALALLAATLLVAGLGLFALRWSARRL